MNFLLTVRFLKKRNNMMIYAKYLNYIIFLTIPNIYTYRKKHYQSIFKKYYVTYIIKIEKYTDNK